MDQQDAALVVGCHAESGELAQLLSFLSDWAGQALRGGWMVLCYARKNPLQAFESERCPFKFGFMRHIGRILPALLL